MAAVTAEVDGVAVMLDRICTDVARSRRTDEAPPRALRGEVARLRGRLEHLQRQLIGRHWSEAEPVLRTLRARRAELDRVEAEMHAESWKRETGAPEPAAGIGVADGTGSLSGTVTEVDGTTPIVGVRVRVFRGSSYVGESASGPAGAWSLGGLAAGTYFVLTRDTTGFVDELWDDIRCDGSCTPALGTPIELADGASVGGVDFALMRTATLQGRVTDLAAGSVVTDAEVTVYDAGGRYVASDWVDSHGGWRVQDLPPGLYFATTDSETHLDELFDDLPCEGYSGCLPQQGTRLVVGPGETRSDVDFELQRAGAIVGTVIDSGDGLPVVDCRVEVYREDGEWETNAYVQDGAFAAVGLTTGTYFVHTSTWGEWRDELWDGVPCDPSCDPTLGTPVTVANGAESVIAFELVRDPRIAGRVTDAATGTPLPTEISFYEGSNYAGWASSYESGWYAAYLDGDGPWTVIARSSTHRDELFLDLPCDPECDPTTGSTVEVEPGAVADWVHFGLDRNGMIEGTVRALGSGVGLEGLEVEVFDVEGGEIAAGYSTVLGHYVVEDLAPGQYFVRTRPGAANRQDWLGQLWDGLPCEISCDPTAGTPVETLPAEITPGIDFELVPAGSLSGQVLDSVTGEPVTGYLRVWLYDSEGGFDDLVNLGATGRYRFEALGPGDYFVKFEGDEHLSQLYDGIPCEPSCEVTTGTPVTVALSAQVTGIDASLDPLATLRGTVRDAVTGLPPPSTASVRVSVYDEAGVSLRSGWVDSAGDFIVERVPAGTCFAATGSSQYLDQVWDGIPCEAPCDPTIGTPIELDVGDDLEGIDFVLDPLGGITGRVVDEVTAQPISGASVYLYDAGGAYRDAEHTSSDGSYTFAGVQDGSYFVTADRGGYARELFDDRPCEPDCDATSGDAIVVARPVYTAGVDFALLPGGDDSGSVSGRITLAETGEPLRSIEVKLINEDGFWYGHDSTDSAGAYLIDDVAPGIYYVVTDQYGGLIDRLYGGGECEPDCDPTEGTPIMVTEGTTVTGIDLALRLPFFADVWTDHWARRHVESVFHAEITAGCALEPLRYCPSNDVLREQMAVFLLKADEGSGFLPPPAVGLFDDVPTSSPYAPWIEELTTRAITAGCGPELFCPGSPVTREQMAVFLLKTVEGSGWTPPAATGVFLDVPADSPYAPWIEELARRAITAGCQADPPLYCPSVEVARDQMAVFLTKAFALPPAP